MADMNKALIRIITQMPGSVAFKSQNMTIEAFVRDYVKPEAERIEIGNNSTLSAAVASIETMQGAMQALLNELSLRKTPVPLPDVVIPGAELVSLLATAKPFPNRPLPGLLKTDTLFLTLKSSAAGYGLRGWSVPADGLVSPNLQIPIISLGAAVPVVLGAFAFR